MRHVYDRIWKTIIKIIKNNKDRKILIASHGCAIRNFACRAMGLPLEKLNDVEWFENTSVSIFDFDEDLNIKILSLNDVSHLDKNTWTLLKQDWWKNKNDRKE
jgi:broad specificity phosphatase PhoE